MRGKRIVNGHQYVDDLADDPIIQQKLSYNDTKKNRDWAVMGLLCPRRRRKTNIGMEEQCTKSFLVELK